MEMMRDMESQNTARLCSSWCYRDSSCILQGRVFDYGNTFNKIKIFIFFRYVVTVNQLQSFFFKYKVTYSDMSTCIISEKYSMG